MHRWFEYGPILLYFAVPAGLIAWFLGVGLRRYRDTPVPAIWWLILAVTAAMPSMIGAAGIALMRDRPRLDHRGSGFEALIGIGALTALIGAIMLVGMTIALSHRRRWWWVAGLTIACLAFIPLTLLALLAAAQMVSGVSL